MINSKSYSVYLILLVLSKDLEVGDGGHIQLELQEEVNDELEIVHDLILRRLCKKHCMERLVAAEHHPFQTHRRLLPTRHPTSPHLPAKLTCICLYTCSCEHACTRSGHPCLQPSEMFPVNICQARAQSCVHLVRKMPSLRVESQIVSLQDPASSIIIFVQRPRPAKHQSRRSQGFG